MTDIISRLRGLGEMIRESEGIAGFHLNGAVEPWDDLETAPDEAADEIESLHARAKAAEAALKALYHPAERAYENWLKDAEISGGPVRRQMVRRLLSKYAAALDAARAALGNEEDEE